MQKKWLVKNPNPELQVTLSNALNIHPVIAQLLINRNIEDVEAARNFLFGDLSNLHDPFLLKDMDVAVDRIKKAKDNKERILIFGDYDADGVTSSVLLRAVFKKMGIEVINYIPHRMNEGYGLNHAIADFAREKGVGLLIAVDCGITAVTQIKALNQMGIDVIVLDHHEPPQGELPDAHAIINPKRKDCRYPFKSLASVGLAFKLSHALLGKINEDYLDLVAIGTITDVAELSGENRIFAKEGLKRISATKNKGLEALIDVAKIRGKKMRPYYVSFILGPRINAAGRMNSAEKSLNLLLSENSEEAYVLAQSLEADNQARQKTQGDIIEEALNLVEREVNFKDHKIIVLSKEGWHRGVLGIVASRITERYYRPTVVISLEDEFGTGSARSIDGFHLFEALRHCADILENYGGHRHAAGLTIRRENIDIFRDTINKFAHSVINAEDLIPTLELDGEIPLSNISVDLIRTIEMLEPYGEGNRAPLFCSRRLSVKGPAALMGKDTLKFWVTDGKTIIQAVGFGMGRFYDLVSSAKQFDIAFSLAVDGWNKEPVVQLELKDIRES